MTLNCVHCLKPFEAKSPSQQYCAPECRKGAAKADRDFQRTRPASYRYAGRPSSGGHVFDLGLQEERR